MLPLPFLFGVHVFDIEDVRRAMQVGQALATELCAGTDTELFIEVDSETEDEAVFKLRLKKVKPCA